MLSFKCPQCHVALRDYLRTVARPPPGVQVGHKAQPRAAVPQF